eukprot:5743315-Amphidinium_carterae.1
MGKMTNLLLPTRTGLSTLYLNFPSETQRTANLTLRVDYVAMQENKPVLLGTTSIDPGVICVNA